MPRRAARARARTCSVPFSAQKKQNQARLLPNPNAMLMSAVAMSPPASSTLGLKRAPSTPDTNLDMPYAMGKMDVIAPICVMSMARRGSDTITGAVYVRLLRVR
jgi:hypothetical protein